MRNGEAIRAERRSPRVTRSRSRRKSHHPRRHAGVVGRSSRERARTSPLRRRMRFHQLDRTTIRDTSDFRVREPSPSAAATCSPSTAPLPASSRSFRGTGDRTFFRRAQPRPRFLHGARPMAGNDFSSASGGIAVAVCSFSMHALLALALLGAAPASSKSTAHPAAPASGAAFPPIRFAKAQAKSLGLPARWSIAWRNTPRPPTRWPRVHQRRSVRCSTKRRVWRGRARRAHALRLSAISALDLRRRARGSPTQGGANYEVLARLGLRHTRVGLPAAGWRGQHARPSAPAFVVMKKPSRCTDYSAFGSSRSRSSSPAGRARLLREGSPQAAALHRARRDPLPTCWCQDSDNAAFATKHYAAKLST